MRLTCCRSDGTADGQSIFYQLHTGHAALVAQPLTGGEPRTIIPCVSESAYSVAAQGIYYVPCKDEAAKPGVRETLLKLDAFTLRKRPSAATPLGVPAPPWSSCLRSRLISLKRRAGCVTLVLRFHRPSLAPQVGFEPTTLRLTAGCSTIELLRNTREVHDREFRARAGTGQLSAGVTRTSNSSQSPKISASTRPPPCPGRGACAGGSGRPPARRRCGDRRQSCRRPGTRIIGRGVGIVPAAHSPTTPQPDNPALRHFSTSAPRHFGTSALQHLGTSALRHFSTSALQHFGTSALRYHLPACPSVMPSSG
jgi:hypothetical protein